MITWPPNDLYTEVRFVQEAKNLLDLLNKEKSLKNARQRIFIWTCHQELDIEGKNRNMLSGDRVLVRDCTRALCGMIKPWSEEQAGFSLTKALWDIARGHDRSDLQSGFFAEMIHLFRGVLGHPSYQAPSSIDIDSTQSNVSQMRSRQLDELWESAEAWMSRYSHGLSKDVLERRQRRKAHALRVLGGTQEEWNDWKWQVDHILTNIETVEKVVSLSEAERASIRLARQYHQPFGVTPYYASLMDESSSKMDMAIRAQVLPPLSYVKDIERLRDDQRSTLDFMGESETSPVELITRRYPAILILKPYNTCPQICVYCQRNWEIEEAMAPDALASNDKIETAIQWIQDHPAIHEVIVTGGDPLALDDENIDRILGRLADVDKLDVIRIGSRTLVTMPMRITPNLAGIMGKYRQPGRRDVCVVTHVQHASEITPDMLMAVDRLKRQGISIFNQHVYTFHVSRRFETALLRIFLRRAGINPYYTFVTKGKEETNEYRVPIARLLQEQKEEARLLPGTRRTDEVVYNLPRLGKNPIRASQHRDLLAVLPSGERLYAFHPWEKHVVQRDSYVGSDVSILSYLSRMAAMGENPDDYGSIWYYY